MEAHNLGRTAVTQYDLLRILSSQINGDLNHEFYSSFVRRVINQSQKSDRFDSNSDILLKMKMAIDSLRDNLILEFDNQIKELPEHPNSKKTIHPNLDDLLQIKDVTARFGISRPTIYEWERKGLNRTQVGGRVYYKLSDINNFIENQKNDKSY
jgi:predicted DNA-binding transcriptional regulator AlpA